MERAWKFKVGDVVRFRTRRGVLMDGRVIGIIPAFVVARTFLRKCGFRNATVGMLTSLSTSRRYAIRPVGPKKTKQDYMPCGANIIGLACDCMQLQ